MINSWLSNKWNFFRSKINVGTTTAIAAAFTALATGFMAFEVYNQLDQLNNLKQFDNFCHLNEIYDKWYIEMPDCLKNDGMCGTWDKLSSKERAWVRRYFVLCAQEYYLFTKDMIPKEMWVQLTEGSDGCNGAVMRNLKEYPILLEGYHAWKSKGDFSYPEHFTEILDKKIADCQLMPAVLAQNN